METNNIPYNLKLLSKLLLCSKNIYSWEYSGDMELLQSNCPNEEIFNILFSLELKQKFSTHEVTDSSVPIVLTHPLGLMWIADMTKNSSGIPLVFHLIGPVFYSDISIYSLEKSLNAMNLSLPVKRQCMNLLKGFPVLLPTYFYETGQMLHYCLTGKTVLPSEFLIINDAPASSGEVNVGTNHNGTWQIEQSLMKIVEDGNMDYRKYFDQFGSMGNIGNMGDGTPLRQIKNQNIVLATLCTRAAIRGGLPAETSYTMSDQYIQQIERCQNVAQLQELYKTMMDDFIFRVHKAKQNSSLSPQIQKCCDYIQFHIKDTLDVGTLAKMAGYAENYLSKKFRQETGQTITEYILHAKINYAKEVMLSKEESIQDISYLLGFQSQSYFCKQFKRVTGVTPTEYLKTIKQ